jgi:hypothetical protein
MKEVSLLLSSADIQQLGAFLNKVPYEYAAPIVNFLNQKIQEQQSKTPVVNESTPDQTA